MHARTRRHPSAEGGLPQDPPYLVGVTAAARLLGISVSTLYGFLRSGALRARKVGRSTLFLRSDLDAFVAALPAFEPQRRAVRRARR